VAKAGFRIAPSLRSGLHGMTGGARFASNGKCCILSHNPIIQSHRSIGPRGEGFHFNVHHSRPCGWGWYVWRVCL